MGNIPVPESACLSNTMEVKSCMFEVNDDHLSFGFGNEYRATLLYSNNEHVHLITHTTVC